jgi:two-component system, chemotaxis family, response regulator PixG
MSTVSTGNYGTPQQLHPSSLLNQIAARYATGCLQVVNSSVSWAIYIENGKLIYATSSADPFGRLDRYLRRLSVRVPNLVSAVRVQARLLFESPSEGRSQQSPDYQAICWLVQQQYLSPPQAAVLIEEIAKEVIELFMALRSGNFNFIEQDLMSEFPKFCQLDLNTIVDYCQSQLRQRQALAQSASPNTYSPDRPDLLSQSTTYLAPDLVRQAGVRGGSSSAPGQNGSGVLPTAPDGRNYTIACIDDSPTVLNAMRSFLADKGVAVVMINDPVKALMQIIRTKPDLILLDITMPNLDGYELCSLVRKHPQFKATPVVMVTSNSGFIDRARAKLVGASGYLTKPFTQPDLMKIVFKHLA